MFSRVYCSILPRLANLQKIQYLSHICENNVNDLNNERIITEKKNDNVFPEIPQIELPSFQSEFNFKVDENGYVNVFTDGACLSNGLNNSKAGIGVWFDDNHPLNISELLEGRSTCNVAEIRAAIAAVNQAKKSGIKKLKINTDSQFLINCVTKWMENWKLTEWKTAKKKPVINKKELQELDNAISFLDIVWVHVSSHTGVYGNEMAHRLANAGIKKAKKIQSVGGKN